MSKVENFELPALAQYRTLLLPTCLHWLVVRAGTHLPWWCNLPSITLRHAPCGAVETSAIVFVLKNQFCCNDYTCAKGLDVMSHISARRTMTISPTMVSRCARPRDLWYARAKETRLSKHTDCHLPLMDLTTYSTALCKRSQHMGPHGSLYLLNFYI